MIVPYKTNELVIAGDKRKYKVFDTLISTKDNSIIVNDEVYHGSLPQCKGFVDGYLYMQSID